MEAKIPFPTWIKPEWHNCIVGCMRCQAACPENKPFLHKIGETVEFTEEDGKTTLFLSSTPVNASETEINMFEAGFESMNQGFKGTFDQLEEYLKRA